MTKSTKSTRRKPAAKSRATYASLLPDLKKGERYAGVLLDDKGSLTQHLILLDGELDAGTWQESQAWAKKQGGALPTRQEQALLFANLKKQFQAAWYWSCEPDAGAAAWAWFQSFYYGTQNSLLKLTKLRARAVRRLAI